MLIANSASASNPESTAPAAALQSELPLAKPLPSRHQSRENFASLLSSQNTSKKASPPPAAERRTARGLPAHAGVQPAAKKAAARPSASASASAASADSKPSRRKETGKDGRKGAKSARSQPSAAQAPGSGPAATLPLSRESNSANLEAEAQTFAQTTPWSLEALQSLQSLQSLQAAKNPAPSPALPRQDQPESAAAALALASAAAEHLPPLNPWGSEPNFSLDGALADAVPPGPRGERTQPTEAELWPAQEAANSAAPLASQTLAWPAGMNSGSELARGAQLLGLPRSESFDPSLATAQTQPNLGQEQGALLTQAPDFNASFTWQHATPAAAPAWQALTLPQNQSGPGVTDLGPQKTTEEPPLPAGLQASTQATPPELALGARHNQNPQARNLGSGQPAALSFQRQSLRGLAAGFQAADEEHSQTNDPSDSDAASLSRLGLGPQKEPGRPEFGSDKTPTLAAKGALDPASHSGVGSPRNHFVEKMKEQVQALLAQRGGKATLHIQDRKLGEIAVAIQVQGQDVRIKMQSPSQHTRDLLGQELAQLQASLAEHKLILSEVNIAPSERQPSAQQQTQPQTQQGQTESQAHLGNPQQGSSQGGLGDNARAAREATPPRAALTQRSLGSQGGSLSPTLSGSLNSQHIAVQT